MIDIQKKIHSCEGYLPYLHSQKVHTPWGIMYFDPVNPLLQAANRAVVTQKVETKNIEEEIRRINEAIAKRGKKPAFRNSLIYE